MDSTASLSASGVVVVEEGPPLDMDGAVAVAGEAGGGLSPISSCLPLFSGDGVESHLFVDIAGSVRQRRQPDEFCRVRECAIISNRYGYWCVWSRARFILADRAGTGTARKGDCKGRDEMPIVDKGC